MNFADLAATLPPQYCHPISTNEQFARLAWRTIRVLAEAEPTPTKAQRAAAQSTIETLGGVAADICCFAGVMTAFAWERTAYSAVYHAGPLPPSNREQWYRTCIEYMAEALA